MEGNAQRKKHGRDAPSYRPGSVEQSEIEPPTSRIAQNRKNCENRRHFR